MTRGWLRKLLIWAAPRALDAAKSAVSKKLGTKDEGDAKPR